MDLLDYGSLVQPLLKEVQPTRNVIKRLSSGANLLEKKDKVIVEALH